MTLVILKDGICHDRACRYTRDCANHTSAGDFRTESGDSPALHLDGNVLSCSRRLFDPEHVSGMVTVQDGRLVADNDGCEKLLYGSLDRATELLEQYKKTPDKETMRQLLRELEAVDIPILEPGNAKT